MIDEHKLAQAVQRQAKAEELMRNEMLQEAFTSIDAAYVEAWRSCPDPVVREQLFFGQGNLRKVREHLTRVVSTGKLAQREIEELAHKRSWPRAV